MPNHIKSEHINRMFPFEFYNELSEHLKSYTLLNPAFILQDKIEVTPAQQKELFYQSRDNQVFNALHENNLLQVEPFGELLTLEVCCPAKDKITVLRDSNKRVQLPLSIIVAQLYDASGSPVFAKDVEESSIERIPEVLWDDPNLMLGIVSFTETEPRVAVIKIPGHIEDRLFESVSNE